MSDHPPFRATPMIEFRIRSPLRKQRLKRLYEGRSEILGYLRMVDDSHWPTRGYGRAVHAYDRARTMWRNYRGWQ